MGIFVCMLFVLGTEPDHLALAAQHLDRGEAPQAITHLTVHVRSHPREAMTRAYLAELLFQSQRHAEAAVEFEAFIAQAQRMTGKPHDHLVHCHTRLMGVAAASGDDYREHLHRGIGLWRLVLRWDADRADTASSIDTLRQAHDALTEAAQRRPHDARVCLYLAEVATRLNQSERAAAAWRKAKAQPPLGLTPAEQERLAIANHD